MPRTKNESKSQKDKTEKRAFSRSELVGKFPHIKHQPAPKAKLLLSEEVHNQLIARMKLR